MLSEKEKELISKLMAPLEYAQRRNFSNLFRLKGLEQTLSKILGTETELVLRNENLKSFQEHLKGLNELSLNAKKLRIKKLIEILKQKGSGKKAERGYKGSALEQPVQYLKGVGPKLSKLLARKGIKTIRDLLFYFPYKYEDRREIKKIASLKEGEKAVAVGKVVALGFSKPLPRFYSGRVFEMVIDDGSDFLICKWFNYAGDFLQKRFQKGNKVVVNGVVRLFQARKEMHHPEIELLEKEGELDSLSFGRIVPLYSVPDTISQKTFRKFSSNAIERYSVELSDLIPEEILKKRGLIPISEAISEIHYPTDEDLTLLNSFRSKAHIRLIYEELFFLELAVALAKKGISEMSAFPVSGEETLVQSFLKSLPFRLTQSQKRVISEIKAELMKPKPMHRLLQGDVGSGKTVVALVSALYVITDGAQVAVMAPSEVLAEQHYLNFHGALEKLGKRTALLTSAVRGKARQRLLEEISEGTVDLIIGTQAVLTEGVRFKRLGLGIIDEQHKFGVRERARLKSKSESGYTPHILVMSATPIPRSLALTAYGDLELSVLDEMPEGRKPVRTKLLGRDELDYLFEEVRRRVRRGEQAYYVCPLIEKSERVELEDAKKKYEELKEVFYEFSLGLIHGRMKPQEKEFIMERFRRKEIQILVATTIIEVGIDVPSATIMVVENAERFGLSQLHQLRGRVARSKLDAVCFLVVHSLRTEESARRLKIMEETNDGFKISEEDLRLRGPGEFFGTRQAGLPELRVAHLVRDIEQLVWAREDAFELVEKNGLSERLYEEVLKRYGKRLKLARAG